MNTEEFLVKQFDRLPPHDVAAEMAVIGSMILAGDNPRLFEAIRAALSRDDFFQVDHQIIFDVLTGLSDSGGAIDGLSVRVELSRRRLLEEVGDMAYLGQIVNCVPSAAHGPHYGKRVRELANLRRLISMSNEILLKCYGPSAEDPVGDVCAWVDEQMIAIQGGESASRAVPLSEAIEDVLQAKRDGIAEREPTGQSGLDALIGGLPRGGFTIIGGRPGMGKSVELKQLILNYASRGLRCGIVSLEETRHKIARNAISGKSGVPNMRLAYGSISEWDWHEIERVLPDLRGLPILINDAASAWSDVARAVTSLVVKHNCQVIGIDYLQLIADDDGRDTTREQEVARISRGLKRLFKRFEVIGIAAVQLNRGNETSNRLPEVRDLRESGQLDQDGDVIILLHRDDYYRVNDPDFVANNGVKLIVGKNKDGAMGNVDLWFCGDRQSITDENPNVPPVSADDF